MPPESPFPFQLTADSQTYSAWAQTYQQGTAIAVNDTIGGSQQTHAIEMTPPYITACAYNSPEEFSFATARGEEFCSLSFTNIEAHTTESPSPVTYYSFRIGGVDLNDLAENTGLLSKDA